MARFHLLIFCIALGCLPPLPATLTVNIWWLSALPLPVSGTKCAQTCTRPRACACLAHRRLSLLYDIPGAGLSQVIYIYFFYIRPCRSRALPPGLPLCASRSDCEVPKRLHGSSRVPAPGCEDAVYFDVCVPFPFVPCPSPGVKA